MRDVLALTALIAVPATVAMLGCSNSPGLTVLGDVTIEASGATTGFSFEEPSRLDGASPNRAITGTCTLTSDVERSAYGVVVDLYAPSTTEGRAVRSVTIMTRTDSPSTGTIEAELGADSFRGTCTVAVPNLSGNGTVTLATEGCTIEGAGETATVDLELTFERCVVTTE